MRVELLMQFFSWPFSDLDSSRALVRPCDRGQPFRGREHDQAGDGGIGWDVYPRRETDFKVRSSSSNDAGNQKRLRTSRQNPPLESPSEAWQRARPRRPIACPNLAYPMPRSPDAPLAKFAAGKMLQQEELSTRHHTPGEGLLMISVGRDGTRRIGVDCFIHIRNSRSLPRSQSPRAAGICSHPPIWELGHNLLLVALLQVNRVG